MRLTGHPIRVFATTALLAAGGPLLAQTGPAPGVTHLDGSVIALACAPTLPQGMYQPSGDKLPAPTLIPRNPSEK